MLNLYLAPRSAKAAVPEEAAVEAALAYLERQRIIGPVTADGERPPGPQVAALFHADAQETLLPAELTFDAVRVESSGRPRFLPPQQEALDFVATCTVCGDRLDPDALADALAALSYFPVDRFACLCPSCRTELTLKEVDFGQSTAVARWWLVVEGAATSRLNMALVEQLERVLGLPLTVVHDVFDEERESFAPPPSRQARRRARSR